MTTTKSKTTASREAFEKIAQKQNDRVAFNVHDLGHLIYQVKIPLIDFSDCGKTNYGGGTCYHLKPYDEGNPLTHPLNKKIVDIRDYKIHGAKNVRLTMEQILRILNEHRDEGFVEYDTNNWLDGLVEWTYLRLPEWQFYPMFFGAIELGHGISQFAEERAKEEERQKRLHPMGKPDIVKQFIRNRRICSCERHRREQAKKGGYYA